MARPHDRSPIRMGFALVGVALALLVLCANTPLRAQEVDPGANETVSERPPHLAPSVANKLLRKGWVAHRLDRKPEEARHLYQRVWDEVSQDGEGVDLKVRAAIGLSMLARNDGDTDLARRYLEWASEAYGASLRWTGSAAEQLRELTRQEDASGLKLLAEMEEQNRFLEARLASLRQDVNDRNVELKRRDELIRKLEERHEESPEELSDGYVELRRDRASLMMESMVQEDQRMEASRLWFLEQSLTKMRTLYAAGSFLRASNEAREALKLDPLNYDAQEMERRCVAMLHVLSGDLPEEKQMRQLERLGRDFAMEAMKDHLKRGRGLWKKGRTREAIPTLQRVLREYIDCPTALTSDDMAVVLQARDLLKKCHAETTVADAGDLGIEDSDLETQVERTLGELKAQNLAEEELRAYLERFKKINPETAIRHADEMIEDFVRFAKEAESAEERKAAVRDAMTLLEWFDDELDADGKRREALSEL